MRANLADVPFPRARVSYLVADREPALLIRALYRAHDDASMRRAGLLRAKAPVCLGPEVQASEVGCSAEL